MYSYAGKILRVNLTTGDIKTEPLTEEMAKQYIGGIGPDLKRAGYDAVIITGKAPKLSYLWIDDDKVQIMNAENLKNATVNHTDKAIRQELGAFAARVSATGEAGEKLCRFAAIIKDEFRAIGRSGMGGVMGSKNLKAVAVRGTHDVNVAKLPGFKDFVKLVHERMKGPATKKDKTR